MRILHTADWHFGRTLEGRSRHDEHVKFIDELCCIVREQKVDLVLVAGDVYDGVNPPAASEELYCDALARLGEGGRRAVAVVAGNHDNPERLAAVRHLAQRHGATILGLPGDDPGVYTPGRDRVQRVAAGPGWCELAVPGVDHTAVLLALAYPSEARLNQVLAGTLSEEDLQAAYTARVGRWFTERASHFRPDALRLAMSHIFVAGGAGSDSERVIQVGGAYTVDPSAFPETAQYVALGHLHRAQGFGGKVRYSGSPLAFDFGEENQVKSVLLMDLKPSDSVPASVEAVPITAGRPLRTWHARDGIGQVERWVSEGLDADAWIDLWVYGSDILRLDEVHRLKKMREGFVRIRTVATAAELEAAVAAEQQSLTVEEQFVRFYQQKTSGGTPAPELIRLFLELAGEAGTEEVEA